MTDKDKIAALEARVAELEAKAKPPEEPKPFVPDPNWQRYDPTAGMSMPRSALEAMIAAEPRGFMAGVVGDNRAPTSPGMIPREQPTGPAGGAPSPTPGYSVLLTIPPPP